MTPTLLLTSRLFRKNRVTNDPIAKYLHSFFVESFMIYEGTLESFGNLLILEFSLSWDLVDPALTDY